MNDDDTVGSLWNAFRAPVPYSEPEPVLEIAERNLEEPKKPDSVEAEFSEAPEQDKPTEEIEESASAEPATLGEPPSETLGAPATGALGALDDLYYRRVWQTPGAPSPWVIVAEGPVRGYGPNCTFEGPTFCSIGPPWVYEFWWRYSPSTIGTGGTWEYAGERKNW